MKRVGSSGKWSLWRNWLRSLWPTTTKKRVRPRRPRLWIEPLEDRVVPAVNALADFPFVDAGTSTTFNVLTNDTNPDGTGLAVLSSTAVAPGGPTLTDNGDGTFTFQSATAGTFSFDYTLTGTENKIVAGDAEINDYFGRSVAVSVDTVVVGANGDDDWGIDSGSAYMFTRSGGTWTQQQKLTAADAAAGDAFGYSVAVSGDTAVVGAFGDNSFSGSAYVFTRSGVTWTQQQKLIASDAAAGDIFGSSVAVSGDTVVVGAGGDDDGGSNAGSAYVFTRSGGTWTQQQKLTASDAAADDRFGFSVAVSADAAVVGALWDDGVGSDSGSAYVFTRSGGTWTEQQKLTADDGAVSDQFGYSVAVSVDTAVVGANRKGDGGTDAGSAYVFTRSGGTWAQQQKLTASDTAAFDYFGWSVAVSGDTVVVGAHYNDDGGSESGSAYVFTRSGSTWTQQQKLAASDAAAGDKFGISVAVNGDTVVVGASLDDDGGGNSGSAYIRNITQDTATVTVTVGPTVDNIVAVDDSVNVDAGTSTTFNVLTNDTNPDGTGLAVLSSTAVAPGGPTLTDNGDGTFTFQSTTTGTFSFDYTVTGAENKILAGDAAAGDQCSFSVSVSGDTAVVGALGNDSYSGSAYVFTRSGGTWTQQQKLSASDATAGDYFGISVAVSGDTVVVGAYGDDDGGSNSGSAYVFTRSGGTWTQQQKLTASDAATFDAFGFSVAVSGDTAVVGACQDDDGGSFSGSAYVFTRSGVTWTQQQKLTASDAAAGDKFGISVAVSADTAVVGAYLDDDGGSDSGSAYVFTRSGVTWTQQQKLIASDAAVGDSFGFPVAVSGDTVVVGAHYNDDGGSDSGSAYVFTRSGGTWTQQQKLTASDATAGDYFGFSVAVSGDTVVVGASLDDDGGGNSGSAYVFTRSGVTWTQRQKLTASDAAANDDFGYSVAVSGDTAVVGAYGNDDSGSLSGSAYIRNVTQDTATATVTVANVNPTITTFSVPASGVEGTAVNVSAAASDPGANDPLSFIWTITKDSNPFVSGIGASFSFTPVDNGSYGVSLTVTDGDGGSATASTTITVSNVAPSAAITGVPASGKAGYVINLGSTVADPGSADVAAGFTRTWNVTKNGNAYASGTGANFSFTPNGKGAYSVTLTARDKDGGTGVDARALSVKGRVGIGHGESFVKDAANGLWVFRDGSGWSFLGGYGTSFSVGMDDQGEDELAILDGVNRLFLYRQGVWIDTGGYGVDVVAGQGQTFVRDGNNQIHVYRDGAGWLATGGYARAMSLGSDSLGQDQLAILDANHRLFLFRQGVWIDTGGYGLTIAAGQNATFLLDGLNHLHVYREGAGWLATGGYARSLSLGLDDQDQDVVSILDGDNRLWLYTHGAWTNTGGKGLAIVAGQDETFLLDGFNVLWVYRAGLGWTNTGGYARRMSLSLDALGQDLLTILDGDLQLWMYASGTWTYTGGGGW